jgi:hypothetical protein
MHFYLWFVYVFVFIYYLRPSSKINTNYIRRYNYYRIRKI